MTVKQMAVSEGQCPLCSRENPKIAEFVNDPCISHGSHVEYRVCKPCKKIWEWTTDSLGVEIVDLKSRMRKMQDDIGSAS